MKKLLFLSLILLPSIMMATPTFDNDVFIGKWISPEYGHTLKIDDYRRGIKVKDSFTGRWIKYRRTSKRTFRSSCGRELGFLDYNTISFRPNRRNPRVIFKRKGVALHSFECQVPHIDNNHYGNSYSPYSNEYDYYGNNGNNHYNDNQDRNRVKAKSFIEGTYLNRPLNHEFILLEDRNGIKTKIKGESKWYYYSKNRNQDNVYTDRVGNTIRRTDLSSIEWKGVNGKRYTLDKLSDATF